ncbi:MAG: DUF1439 domain-containing protein, partial [Epsilonproteobacteria bacterium]|nr:DUF1439 domain-containing protein [Campylobacterota bacterium]
MKKIKLGFVLVFILTFLAGCVGVNPKTGAYSVIVPMKTIDAKVKTEFPLEKKIQFGKLNLSNPSVIGSEIKKDKLAIKVDFKLSNFLFSSGIKGGVELTSGIRYDAKTKNLYLDNPMLDELTLQNSSFSKILTPSIRAEIEKIIAQIVTYYPIYSLENSSMATGFIKSIDIV